MALKQTKVIKKNIDTKRIHKTELALELKVDVATINEYILGDTIPPNNLKIVADKDGHVNVEYTIEKLVPKYDGIFYNELKNGDKTFYIVYKDMKNKKIDLKIGKASEGITEQYCSNKRTEILQQLRLGETPKSVKNRRVYKNITTFDMVAERYIDNRKLHLSAENLRDLKNQYKTHIKPFIGDKPLEEITQDDVEELMLKKQETLAYRTINIIVEKISTIFNFAINKKIFKSQNPIQGIEKLDEDNERTRFLSKEEIQDLLEAVKYNDTVHLFTLLALSTGARLGTICRIKIKDVDLTHRIINLYDTKNRTYYKAFIKEDPTLLSLLSKFTSNVKYEDFLLGRATLTANYRYIQRELSKVLNNLFNKELIMTDNLSLNGKAEIRRNKVVIHTLRHTFASQLVINGTPLYTVQQLLNHKDINMTQRYAKLAPDSGRDSINSIF